MRGLKFEGLYDPKKSIWISPAYVELDDFGKALSVSDAAPNGKNFETVDGWAMPGFINTHSHAFQYAMAGLAEFQGKESRKGKDNFWSWREEMYALANKISSDELENIAFSLYREMLRNGYTWVVEFHYLHDPKSKEINISRLIAAAKNAGIGITMVPVFYNKGGFGKAATKRQARFLFGSADEYLDFVKKLQKQYEGDSEVIVGSGIHSLRASDLEDVLKILGDEELKKRPQHIHIAEQALEVEDCLKSTGKRPVEFLLQNGLSGLNLVHATHINESELKGIVDSESTVVLCPSTEGNLGDGFFPISKFVKLGGRFSIGTDSQVGLNPFEELRWLDYQARLTAQTRNELCQKPGDDSGEILINEVFASGRKSAGLSNDPRHFEETFDVVVMKSPHRGFNFCLERLVSKFVYTADSSQVLGTIKKGKWVPKNI